MINYMDGLNDVGAVVRLSQVPIEILIVRIECGCTDAFGGQEDSPVGI